MTVNDLVNLICTKLNQNEPEDLAACQTFLQARYKMIWNDQLWKDAIIDWTYTLPAAGTAWDPTAIWLPTKQDLILPAQFDRVLAVRTDTRKLNIQSAEVFYRADFDAFANGGMLVDYILLPPAVWEMDVAASANLQGNVADGNVSVNVDVLRADGATVARDVLALTTNANGTTPIESVLRIDSISKPVTHNAVQLTAGPVIINNTAAQTTFATLDPALNLIASYTIQPGASAFVKAQANFQTYVAVGWPVNLANFAMPGGGGWSGTATITDDGFGGFLCAATSTGVAIVTLQPADLTASRRQRIHLMGTVDVPAPTLRVLGKGVPNALTSLGDSTMLTGVDNPLIAIVEYDMLQRERQYQKAGTKMQEFSLLLDQLKREHVVQQAHQKQIKPEDGYGNPYDLWSHPPLTF